MEKENTGEEKKGKGWLKAPGTYILICLESLLLLVGQLIGMTLHLLPSIGDKDVWDTIVSYGEFIGIWISTIIVLAVIRKNRPILLSLGKKSRGNTLPLFALGILLGFAMIGVCALAAVLHGDISLRYGSFQPLPFILIFIAVFIQSGAEELVCRGFMYQRLRRSFKSPLAAVFGNALFFAALHLANDGVTFPGFMSDLLVGILFSFIVYYMESIWCVMALHTAWNFMQNIVLGLPNSGNLVPYSVFKLEDGAVNSFFYDTGFGIEGSLFSSLVILVAIASVVLWGRKHNPAPLDIWTTGAESTESGLKN